MKRTKTKILSVFLSVCMIISCMVGMSVTASAASSGKFGNFNWTMDDDGNMTISGDGAFPSGSIEDNPDVKSIVFDENCAITKIQNRSIGFCSNLTSVVVNSTVPIEIDRNTFNGSNDKEKPTNLSIVINAPEVSFTGEQPFWAYKSTLNITIQTDKLTVEKIAAMTYLADKHSVAYPENSYLHTPAGKHFDGPMADMYQHDYDYAIANGDSQMADEKVQNAIYDGCTVTDVQESTEKITSANVQQVFGSAKTSTSGGYVAPAGKTAGSITYTTTEVEKVTDAAQFTNPLTKVGDGEVTYSITGDVATINATTGQVVLTGKAGTATVTATVADSDDYEYATKTATYELTTKLPELYPSPIFTFSSDDYIYWVAHWVPEQGAFPRSAGDITKIEALIDVRSISWGVIQLGSAGDTQGDSYSILPSECKAVSYEGTMPEASYAQVVLSGDADLWGVRVTYKDGTVVSDGTWSIPEYTIPTGLEATEGDTLSDVELPTGWSWLNSSEYVGTVGDNKFEAEYSETGYFPVAKDLTVTVNSAGPVTPTITTAPTASAITYGQTLKDSNLSGGAADVDGTFSWTTDTIAPAVADSNTTEYDVTFTPNDTDNYTTAACKVKLTVGKADPTADDFIFNAPENLSYDDTDKTATVVPDPEVTGMGEVTVKYYSDAECTTEAQNTHSAGTYYVGITVTEGDNYSATTSVLYGDDWQFTIGKADPTAEDFIFNAPENLSYDGTDKTATVVPDPEVTGIGEVTVKYYSDAECTTEVQNTRSAGTYYVGITVTEGDNYSAATSVLYGDDWQFTIGKAEPTADDFIFNAPENLSYDDTDKTATVVPDSEVTGMGEVTVKYYSNPECTTEVQNTRSAGTYYVGITVTEGDNYSETTSVLHGDDWQFTIGKADPTADDFIFNAPENLSYDGTDKTATVVPDPEVTGMGEVTVKYYSNPECTTEVQNTRSAGTYYVGITVTEGDNYSEITLVLHGDDWQFTIGKADPTVTAPTENELTYNGSAQALVTGGSVTGGELQYSLDGTDYSAAVPTATDAGDYRVYYKVVGDENHSDTKPASITVTIAKAASSVTTAPAAKKLTFNGEKQELVTAGTAEGGTMQYSLNGGTYSADIPTAIAAGTYTVYYKAVGDKNHKDSEPGIVKVTIAAPVIPTPYNTFYDPSDTTTTTTTTNTTPDITKYTITGEQDRGHWIRLKWDVIQDEMDYRLYLQSRGQYVFLMDLGNANNANVVRSTSGRYYVSTGGDYSIFEYDSKTGQFTQTGTLEASKIDSIKKANNVTEDFMVKYIVDGKESTESNSYKVSVNIYYKPAVQITANKGSIMLRWNKVPGATKYRVYKYVNNKLKLVTETTRNAVLITGTKAGKKYSYAVKAYVDGKWTKVYKSDIVSVTAK